jgi:hypothetical protein
MDIIDILTDLDESIVNWLIHATPKAPEDEAAMKKLVTIRTELDDDVHTIVLKRLQLAALDLQGDIDKLNELSKRLDAAAKDISSVRDVVSIASTVVGVAASVVTLLA